MQIKKRLTVSSVDYIRIAAQENTPLYMAKADAIVTAIRENVCVELLHCGKIYLVNPGALLNACNVFVEK